MIKKMIPSFYAKTIFTIDYTKLLDLRIENLFFDLDNTLTAYYNKTPNSELITFIDSLKHQGFRIFLISNNHENRVSTFAKPLHIEYLYETKKPSSKRLRKFIDYYHLNYDSCVLIGDQLLTDVICANSLRIHSILVEPFVLTDLPITRFNRFFDKIIRRKLKNKNLLNTIEKEES